MPITRFDAESWPRSAGEFRRIVRDAWQGHAPIGIGGAPIRIGGAPLDDFVQLVRDLTLLEQKHGLSSTEFLQRYQRGEMGDDMEFVRWATKVEMYEEMKADLDDTLALLEQYALPSST